MTTNPNLQAAFTRGHALKIISGLTNFNTANVLAVANAAQQGGATFVDVAADANLVRRVSQQIDLPICVSAIDPDAFLAPVAAGASVIEIGNFDAFYAQGLAFNASDVLTLTQRTRELLPYITLSVTVPHTLPLTEQVQLAEKLVAMGADILQTEGGTSSQPTQPGSIGLIEKATPTLAAAHAISHAVKVPVLCASGISEVTAPMAIAAGAAGVGVGSAVNKLNDGIAMVAAVRRLREALKTVTRLTATFN
ncbi:MAG: DUF561 domain-containing protein [Symploca sp. SIO2G7]|nr:DUF561 domain-containing protein [Symploca sp. SIO2G7]